jgi:purine-binding chemotaxis protein CheW
MTQSQINTESVSSRKQDIDEQQLVCFRLADEEFGVDINTVREIVRVPEITYIPRAPDYVKGIANLRGNVLPVIDGRIRLFLPETQNTERTRVLILDINGNTTGIIVDAVNEVKRIDKKDIELPPVVTQGGVDSSFLSGVVKLDGGKRLILNIRPEEVLNIEAASSDNSQAMINTSKSKDQKTEKRDKDELMELQFVSFVVDNEEYAFDIGVVKEILRLTEITAVPNAPAHVRGLFTVRSVLLPILDLRIMLGIHETEAEEQRVLVVEVDGLTVGLLVDKVNEVLRVPVSVIDETPKLAAGGQELRSVAQLEDGKRLILILNERGLINTSEVSTLIDTKANKLSSEKRSEGTVEEKQLVTFFLGDEEYGFEITQVQEINRLGEVTRLPKAPPFVAGITNLRGQVVPLINLRQRFNLEDKKPDDRTRIIIIELSGHRTGIIVDQVNEVLRLLAKDIEPAPSIVRSSHYDDSSEFMSGVCKVNNGERMILLMDTFKLLSTQEANALESMSANKPKTQAKTQAKVQESTPEVSKTVEPKKTSPQQHVSDDLEMVIEE